MIRKNSIGTELLGTVRDQNGTVVDISTATLAGTLVMRKPSGAVVTRTPTLKTDGTDGRWSYVSVSGDLDDIGDFQVQFFYVNGGSSIPGDPYTFQVGANLNG